MSPTTSSTSRRRLLGVVSALALSGLSISLVALNPDTILAGDAAAYRERVEAILDGGLPYLDVPFEHLPVMLAPMFAAWYLGGAATQASYVAIYAALMAVALAATTLTMSSVGESSGDESLGGRWLLVSAPLFPLVLFRNDPIVTLLATLAILGLVRGWQTWWIWGAMGGLAKIWPAALSTASWRKAKTLSLVVAVSGAIGLAITQHSGFEAARDATGLHAETLVGSLVALARTISGEASGVVVTSAAYLAVPTWVIALNTLIGLTLTVLAVGVTIRARGMLSSVIGVGAIVTGIILTSPLFSLQYVLWMTPFLVVGRRRTGAVVAVVLSLVTIGLGWVWSEAAFESPLFNGFVSIRNLLVLGAGGWLAAHSRSTQKS